MRIKNPAILEAGCFSLAGERNDTIHWHVGFYGDAELHPALLLTAKAAREGGSLPYRIAIFLDGERTSACVLTASL
jgi:hypothetical protein